MKPTVQLSIIVPFFNERESLPELFIQLRQAMEEEELHRLFTEPFSYELLMVDDGSTDGSLEWLEEQEASVAELNVLSFQRNFGKTAALSAGFRYARGEYIVSIDADLQDDPFSIKALVAKLQEGYDMVSGWKLERKDPLSKTLASRLFNSVTRSVTGIRLHDFNCGLKAYRRSVVEMLDLHGEMHRYIPVVVHWNGFRVAEHPVRHNPRKYGTTKYGISRVFPGLFDLLTVLFITRYLKRPMHFFGMLSFLSFITGFGISLYVTIEKYLFNQAAGNRPILFLGILLIILAAQFLSIGLLGEMLTRNHRSTPDYVLKKKGDVPK